MRRMIILIMLLAAAICAEGRERHLAAYWSFDEIQDGKATDAVREMEDEIAGNFWTADGVKGKCLKLDGYTTHLVRQAGEAPRIGGDFTIEAWVAPQTYPWNWTGIVDWEQDRKRGFFFGISADGNVGLGLSTVSDGQWVICISKERIEPLKWSHIAGTYNESGEIAVYINGRKCGEFSAEDYGWEYMGNMRRPRGVDLWIGRSHQRMYPKGTERSPSRRELSNMIFDGLIDEVKIHRGSMDEDEIRELYEKVQPKERQPLQWRRFPTEGADRRQFGAFYTTLKYDEAWDSHWRMAEDSDVVVTFEKPVRVVFWRGINYAASYVTENEIWMGDQSLEGYSAWGCNEHMSDKQCRYAHVRIIENNPARVIVHWRYALVDIIYQIVNTDSQSQWGDWADEYFVIYPDAVVVRQQTLRSSNHEVPYSFLNEMEDTPKHQFQETIMFNQPGTWPRDNVDAENSLTLATMEGETFKCVWGENMEYEEEEILNHEIVKNATIQLTNLKSIYKPFIIFETGSRIEPWVGEGHSFWNHWPVAQLPSDGRFAPSNDRPSHTSFSNGVPVVHSKDNKHSSVMLYGLTPKPIEELAPLARSWNYPAELKVLSGDIESSGYSKFGRAYVLECGGGASDIKLEVSASEKSPLVNPAFVFKGWGEKEAVVEVSGERIYQGREYRAGYERKIDGVNLVLWFDGISKEHETLSITPVK